MKSLTTGGDYSSPRSKYEKGKKAIGRIKGYEVAPEAPTAMLSPDYQENKFRTIYSASMGWSNKNDPAFYRDFSHVMSEAPPDIEPHLPSDEEKARLIESGAWETYEAEHSTPVKQ